MAEKDIPTLWYAATMERPSFHQDASCEVFTSKAGAVKYVQEQGGKAKVRRIVPGLYTYERDRGDWTEQFYVIREDKLHVHGFEWARELNYRRRFSEAERCLECEGYGYDTDDRGVRLLCCGCVGTGFGERLGK